MKPTDKIAEMIRKKLLFAAGPTLHRQWLADILDAQEQSARTRPMPNRQATRGRLSRLAAVIAIAAAIMVPVALRTGVTAPAYAIEQTVEALNNVRLLHLVTRDDTGQIKEERWIEIGSDGRQARYQQNTPPDFFVVDDGSSTAVYHHEKKAVTIYDHKQRQYEWVTYPGEFFENFRREGRILRVNDTYQGRRAHKVWWPAMSSECYVDPRTKLPIAIGKTRISYEPAPPGTFVIAVPKGYAVFDRRPGVAAGSVPAWLIEEDAARRNVEARFGRGADSLARGDYAQAVEDFEYIVGTGERSNWAWFWLGRAYYGLGRYDLASEKFTRVLETLGEAYPCYYCNYARGLAYARLAMHAQAKADFQVCLPPMIHTLRMPSTGWLFEFADNPLIRYGQDMPSNRQIVTHMIQRLRLITGRDFGYDPNATDEQNEAAITAWEQWLKNDGQIRFTPDAEDTSTPAGNDSANR